MNSLESFARLAQAFGLTLVHSIWQIAVIWLIFRLLEWRLNRRHQSVYLLSLMAMLLSAVWSIATFAQEWARLKPVGMVLPPAESAMEAESLTLVSSRITTTLSQWESSKLWIENHAAQIGWVWLACAGLLWLRLIGGWWLAQRLRRSDVLPAAIAFQHLTSNWAKRLKINSKIQLLESPHIVEPLTLGFWKPVILFPMGMLLQLSPEQVEALLLHELAHIRRHDYLVNLFQLATEVCFFYHPLFWLLSREARSRREFCCDAVVLQHTPDPILYAKTLTNLQLSFLQPSTQFAMNATGKSRFTERILHIAGISPKRTARPNWLIAMMLPAIVALCSWWPLPTNYATAATNDTETDSVLDTTPPRNFVDPTTIAMPKTTVIPDVRDTKVLKDAGKKTEKQNQSVPVQMPTENIAIEVVKMNIFYIGVENPLRIAAAGIPASELRVQLIGNGTIEGSQGNYIVLVFQPGEITVRVTRQVGVGTKLVADQKYRVKSIPDPSPKMDGKYSSGPITAELMHNTKGIFVGWENFDFDAECIVVGFEATYLPLGEDPYSRNNKGGQWNSGVLEDIKKAKPGDTFFFDDIKVKCPGDVEPRNVGGLAFKIRKAE